MFELETEIYYISDGLEGHDSLIKSRLEEGWEILLDGFFSEKGDSNPRWYKHYHFITWTRGNPGGVLP